MRRIQEALEEKKVLIAAHRGMFGADIPCNSIPAFRLALRAGADILEMDLFKSTDGEVFLFHNSTEPFFLGKQADVMSMSAWEVRRQNLVNTDHHGTRWNIPSFDEVLEAFQGQCYLNLDRAFNTGCFREAVACVRRHGMEDQILLKSAPTPENLRAVEELAPDMMYMPVIMENDTVTERIEAMNINYAGAELVFAREEAPIAQEGYLERHIRAGRFLWVNAIEYDHRVPLAAGHCDNLSLLEDPDRGWGWLVDRGFRILQTDWTAQCRAYLDRKLAR